MLERGGCLSSMSCALCSHKLAAQRRGQRQHGWCHGPRPALACGPAGPG